MNNHQLDDKVALVTASGGGIGRASAMVLANHGARVVVSDISVEGGEETVSLIRAAGGEAIFVRADISKGDDIRMLVDRTVETYGRLDIAHNNAGIGGSKLLADEDEAVFDRVCAINLKGTWLGMKYQIPHMLKQGKGSIINTASAAGLVAPHAAMSAYVATKHAIVGLTKAAAVDYATQGIRVNAICPGAVRTEMVVRAGETRQMNPVEWERLLSADQPIARLARPEEIGDVVAWLASDASSFVTGTAIPVDGGLTAH